MSALELRSSDGRLVRTARSHILTDLADTSFRGDASAQPGLTASSIRGATEARTNSSPGRARHKPSDHCAGKAGRFRLHLCFLCASLRISSAQRPWVPAGTRSSLRPLSTQRVRRRAKLGQTCRENVDVCLQFEMRIERPPCASTPSLRGAKRRSNPDCHRGETLDCFAALAMTLVVTSGSTPDCERVSAFSRHVLPELCLSPYPLSRKRAQGRPGAGRHPWPLC